MVQPSLFVLASIKASKMNCFLKYCGSAPFRKHVGQNFSMGNQFLLSTTAIPPFLKTKLVLYFLERKMLTHKHNMKSHQTQHTDVVVHA